jgi:hypothetical protein
MAKGFLEATDMIDGDDYGTIRTEIRPERRENK